MPFWCGTWEAAGGWWWLFPLAGLALMAAMAFVCLRGFDCMGRRAGRAPTELAELQRELHELKQDFRKLRNPG